MYWREKMGLTSVWIDETIQKELKEKSMTIRGAILSGLRANKERLDQNDLLMQYKSENDELRRRVEFLARQYHEMIKSQSHL